ncbi:hypothetical protein WBP07_09125 [Novosphingobium sp. BL-8A]|uniref:hypothetical protein n=1 Tax=Novosphingobium sp. BL-8A TaxID=3127639 RepID=UPI003757AF99
MAVFARRVAGALALVGLAQASLILTAGSALAQEAQTAPTPTPAPTPPLTPPIVVQGDKPQPAASASAIDQADPIRCEMIREIGSRLKVKKVCLTKSQWDAQKREDRMNIERSQMTRGVGPNG